MAYRRCGNGGRIHAALLMSGLEVAEDEGGQALVSYGPSVFAKRVPMNQMNRISIPLVFMSTVPIDGIMKLSEYRQPLKTQQILFLARKEFC
jgi:hypothetical protein